MSMIGRYSCMIVPKQNHTRATVSVQPSCWKILNIFKKHRRDTEQNCHCLAEIQSDLLTRCSFNIDNAFTYNINSPTSIRNCTILYNSHHPKFLFLEFSPIYLHRTIQIRYLISLQFSPEFWNVTWLLYTLCYGLCTVQATLAPPTVTRLLGNFDDKNWKILILLYSFNAHV